MLLQPAKPEMAFVKLGIYGEAKSGKTWTSSLVAIGLKKLLGSKKPIGFIDTETGSDFVLVSPDPTMWKAQGIEMLRMKTRAFSDLIQILDESVGTLDILIIDSITHFWSEIVAAYKKANKINFMTLKHWGPLKETWKEYTDRFINSRLHIIVAGRSMDKWEEVEDPNDGAKELRKTGTRMRTEGQFAYEPSLLVEMEAVQSSARIGGEIINRAHVKGDRFGVMNGAVIDNPTLESFMPHISLLSLGGEHKAFEEGRDSTALFQRDDIGERRGVQRDILLEKIQNEIKKLYPGQTKDDFKGKVELLEELFKTNSWTELEKVHAKFPNERLAEGLKILEGRVAQVAEDIEKAEAKAQAHGGNGKPKAKEARS